MSNYNIENIKPGNKAIESVIKIHFDNSIDNFVSEINRHFNKLLGTDMKKAGTFLKRARNYFDYLPESYKPKIMAINARYFQWCGDHDKALIEYNKALKQNNHLRNFSANARLKKGIINCHLFLGNYHQAIKTGQSALRYFRNKKMRADAAQILANIGNVYHRMDNNPMALRYYNRARDIYKKIGGHGLALIEFNRANIFANLGEFKKARRLYQAASDYYTDQKMEIAANQARYSIACLDYLEGNLTEALKTLENISDQFNRLGDKKSAVIARIDLIEVNLTLNQYSSALMIARDIIPILEDLKMTYEEGKTHYYIFQILFALNEFKKADQSLKEAKRCFDKEQNKILSGMFHLAKSHLRIHQQKYKLARREAEKSVKLFKTGKDSRRLADARVTLSETLLKSRDFKAAAKIIAKLKNSKLINYQKYHINVILGNYHYENKDHDRALTHLRKAASDVDRILAGIFPDEIRMFFLSDKYDTYTKLIDCMLKTGKTTASAIQRLRQIDLLIQKGVAGSKKSPGVPGRLLKNRRELKAQLHRLFQLPKERIRQSRPVSEIVEIENRLWKTERKIRTYLYPVENHITNKSLIDHRFRKHLGKNELLLNYMAIDSKLMAFCISRNRVVSVDLGNNADRLYACIRKLNFLCEDAVKYAFDPPTAGNIELYLREIYAILIKPVESFIDNKKLIFLLDGRFLQIPFGILKDNIGRAAKDIYKFNIILDPKVILKRAGSKINFKAKRNAVFTVTSEFLPSVAKEGRSIRSSFKKVNLYTGKTPTAKNLYKELKIADGFVHIAAHASRSHENPLFSQILMKDGPFFPFDMFNIKMAAELITLSGCQTAAPGLYYGDSYSLAGVFSQAGAGYVLAALWTVSDDISMIFMNEFYGALNECNDIQVAYTGALNKLHAITKNPAHRGAFVLIGA